jgi:hypothetical protein
MRFSVIATAAAAVLAIPMALYASAPRMSGEEFLQAVRCTAVQDIARPDAELGLVKMQLNAEARRQPAEMAALARAEVRAIAHVAAEVDLHAYDGACAARVVQARGAAVAHAWRRGGSTIPELIGASSAL